MNRPGVCPNLSGSTSAPAQEDVQVATTLSVAHLDPYSSFDSTRGERILNGQAEWAESEYVSWALDTADLPGHPTGRVMQFEVASHPSPQVILTQDHAGAMYRAVLFELHNVGGPLAVLDVTPEHTVASALRELPVPVEWISIVADLRSGLAVSYINRQLADAFSVIPPQADVVHIVRTAAANAGSVPSLAATGSASGTALSYTVIDAIHGAVLRRQPSSGTVRDCVLAALTDAGTGFQGEVLKSGLPVPQVVLLTLPAWDRQRTYVVDLRPVGSAVHVVHLQPSFTLRALCTGDHALAHLLTDEGLDPDLLRTFVDGVLTSSTSTLAVGTQTIIFRPRSDPIFRGWEASTAIA